MNKLNLFLTFVIGLILSVGITGVSLPPAKAGPTGLPPGAYTTTITEADIPASFPPDAGSIPVGEWQIEFHNAGDYTVNKFGEVKIVGRSTTNNSRVIFTDLAGEFSCTDEPGIATGVYGWALANDQLTLTTVHDRCTGRELVLTVHPLQMQ